MKNLDRPSMQPAVQHDGPRGPYVEFTVRLAWALHRYGAPAHRLEEVAQLMAERLGVPGQFLSMPTAFIAAFGPWWAQRSFLVRIDPGDVDLQKQVHLDGVAEQVAAGSLDPDAGMKKIDAIMASPPRYGAMLTLGCFSLASAAACRFFGGGWREIGVSGAIGLVVGLLSMLMGREKATARVFGPVAALITSVLAALAAWWIGPLSTSITVLGGLIVLVPGLTVTTALNELATRHLISGTGRLMGAMMEFLFMGLGVTLGGKLAALVPGNPGIGAPLGLPFWTEVVAMLVGLLSFCVLLRVPARETPWTIAIGSLIYFVARSGSDSLGHDLAGGIAAFLTAASANLYARVRKRPAAIVLVPSLMLLVPGSIGFRSLISLLERNVLSGVETAFQMVMTGVSLVTGLLLANVFLPPKRAL